MIDLFIFLRCYHTSGNKNSDDGNDEDDENDDREDCNTLGRGNTPFTSDTIYNDNADDDDGRTMVVPV